MITIALTKGRILKETLPLLMAAGIEPVGNIATSRKLRFDTNHEDMQLLVLRGVDVITYIRRGVADFGVVGKDMLMEDGGEELYELFDLEIAKCRLMTAGLANQTPSESLNRIRVATKYVNVAKKYYARNGVHAEIIKLYGGMELAPLMGLADEIVDIVDTGKTLKANGLVPNKFIADVSSRLVVNKASMKVKHKKLLPIAQSMADAAHSSRR